MLDSKTIRVEALSAKRQRILFQYNGAWVTVREFSEATGIPESTLRARVDRAQQGLSPVGAHDLLSGPGAEWFNTRLPWIKGSRPLGGGGAYEFGRYHLRNPSGEWVTITDIVSCNRWTNARMLRKRIRSMLAKGTGSFEDLLRRRKKPATLSEVTLPKPLLVEEVPWVRTFSDPGPAQPWVHLVTRGL